MLSVPFEVEGVNFVLAVRLPTLKPSKSSQKNAEPSQPPPTKGGSVTGGGVCVPVPAAPIICGGIALLPAAPVTGVVGVPGIVAGAPPVPPPPLLGAGFVPVGIALPVLSGTLPGLVSPVGLLLPTGFVPMPFG